MNMSTKNSSGNLDSRKNKIVEVKETGLRNGAVGSIKKMEYSREYRKLKQQEEFLEKNLASAIRNLKIDAELIRQIDDDHQKASAQRQTNVETLTRAALTMVKELNSLKSMLEEVDARAIRNLNLTDCRLRLTKLSKHIEDFKVDKSNLDILAREEVILATDLRGFEKAVFTEKVTNTLPKTTGERKCSTHSEGHDEFTELIARTGHSQGWSNEDHSLFLKMRKKCDSVPRLVTEIRQRRPHLTNEEIVNHEAWHKLYTELRDKRKRNIAEWKLRRKDDGPVVKVDNTELDNGQKKRRGMKIDEENEKKVDKNKKKKEMIEEWKAERARKSAMDEEQKKRLEKAKAEEEKRRRDNARDETRIKLRDYREKRAEKSTDLRRSTSQPILRDGSQTSSDSLRLIRSFREQDERFIRKRLSCLKVSRKSDDEELPKGPSGVLRSGIKPREYSTLFAATKGWEERCKREVNAEDVFGRINYIKNIQRLSAPRL